MAVKIKLKRLGKTHAPQYRIVVADSRTARNGRAIEEIGIYQPLQEPSLIKVDSERAQYWLGVGAQPTDSVLAILKVTGDWQKFKGLPGAEGTLKVAEPKASKVLAYEEAVKQAAAEPKAAKKPRLDVAAAADTVVTAVEDAVEKAVEVVEEVVEAVVEAVEETVEKVVDAVEDALGADKADETTDEPAKAE